MSLKQRQVFNPVPYEKKRLFAQTHYESPKHTQTSFSEKRKPSPKMIRPSISAQVRTRQKKHSELFKNNVVSNAIEQQKELERQGKEELEHVKFSHRPKTNQEWRSFVEMRRQNSVGYITRLRKAHERYAEAQLQDLRKYRTIEYKQFDGPVSMSQIRSASAQHEKRTRLARNVAKRQKNIRKLYIVNGYIQGTATDSKPLSSGLMTASYSTPKFYPEFPGQEKMFYTLAGEDEKDQDPYLMKRAKDFARMSVERQINFNRIALENKIPIEKVLKTAKSRGYIQEGSERLNDLMALNGALAVGAKIREDLEGKGMPEPEMVQKRIINMRKYAPGLRVKTKVKKVCVTEPPSKLSKYQIRELSVEDERMSYQDLLAKILKVRQQSHSNYRYVSQPLLTRATSAQRLTRLRSSSIAIPRGSSAMQSRRPQSVAVRDVDEVLMSRQQEKSRNAIKRASKVLNTRLGEVARDPLSRRFTAVAVEELSPVEKAGSLGRSKRQTIKSKKSALLKERRHSQDSDGEMFEEEGEGYIKDNREGTTEFRLKYNAFISDKSPTSDLTLRNHIDKDKFKHEVGLIKYKVRKYKDFIHKMKSQISDLDDAIYFNTAPTHYN